MNDFNQFHFLIPERSIEETNHLFEIADKIRDSSRVKPVTTVYDIITQLGIEEDIGASDEIEELAYYGWLGLIPDTCFMMWMNFREGKMEIKIKAADLRKENYKEN